MARELAEELEHRIIRVEGDVGTIKEAIVDISHSLQALTRLEERHAETRESLARAFTQIESNSRDIRAIQVEMPTIKMTSGLVIKVLIGLATLAAAGIGALYLGLK